MEKYVDLERWVRPHILKMKGYRSARDTFNKAAEEMVLLDANENPYLWSFNRYPDPYQLELREHLATRYSVSTKNLMLGNGSDEVLDLLIRATCEPDTDKCMLLPPTYGMYGVLGNLNRVKMLEVPLDNEFQPDVEAILEHAGEKTKLLFLCSPNNPTGNLFEEERIEAILDGFNGLVVIDEAYIDFAQAESWVNRLSDFDNLVVVQTLSKAYGMAGLRLGMCYARPELIEVLLKIKPPYNINGATQNIALERLLEKENLTQQRDILVQERDRLSRQLATIGLSLIHI